MNTKRIGAMVMAVAISASLLTVPASAMDIKETDWFYTDMTWLNTQTSIVDAAGNYKPNDPVNVQTFVQWFAPVLEIKTAKGYGDMVTRNEAAKLLSQAMGLEGNYKLPGYNFFSDSSDTNVKLMCILQIMAGVGNNRFDGARNINRAELATLVHRVERLKGNYWRLLPYKIEDDSLSNPSNKPNNTTNNNNSTTTGDTYDINDALFVPIKKGDFYPIFESMMNTGVYSASFTYAEGTDFNKYLPAMKEAYSEITSDYYYFFSLVDPTYTFIGSTLNLSLNGVKALASYDIAKQYVTKTLETLKTNGTIKDSGQSTFDKTLRIVEYMSKNFDQGVGSTAAELVENKEGDSTAYTSLLNLFLQELGIKANAVKADLNGSTHIVTYVDLDGRKAYVDAYNCNNANIIEIKNYRGEVIRTEKEKFLDLDHYFARSATQLNKNENEKWTFPSEGFGF